MIRGQAGLRLIAVAFSGAILALLSVCLPLSIDLSTHRPVKPRPDQKVNLISKHARTINNNNNTFEGTPEPMHTHTQKGRHRLTSMLIFDDKIDAASLKSPCVDNRKPLCGVCV